MIEPLLLYSTATRLAVQIAQQYYRDKHFLWCSPLLDGGSVARGALTVPPTSSPYHIYWGLYEEVEAGDRHSERIGRNRIGIVRGAEAKKQAGVIDEKACGDIIKIVEAAEGRDFTPLLLVLAYARAKRYITEVPVGKRAHPLSQELLVPSIAGRFFESIELKRL